MSKTKAKPAKVKVTRRAVIQRVNRALAAEKEGLRVWRTSGAGFDAGDLYHLDYSANAMLNDNVDLERFAREIAKVLQPWEEIAD